MCMPRFARQTIYGAVYHVISRFVNREFRIRTKVDRSEYLRRVGVIAPRTRWRVLGYALMSSHIHWVLQCGGEPIRNFIHPLHVGFGAWLNRTQNRIGPVFANRPMTVIVPSQDTLRLLAYVHNNPVRAGIAEKAIASTWSSHRHYIEPQIAPEWLDIAQGMKLCGFQCRAEDRRRFDDSVHLYFQESTDPILTGGRATQVRTEVREAIGWPVELESPVVQGESVVFGVNMRPGVFVSNDPIGSIPHLIHEVTQRLGVNKNALLAGNRARCFGRARRLILMTACRHLGHSIVETARALGIASSSASNLLNRRPHQCAPLEPVAKSIAANIVRSEITF